MEEVAFFFAERFLLERFLPRPPIGDDFTFMENDKPSQRGSLFSMIAPGLLVAATGVGAGDLATAAFTGKQLGVAVLWAVLVGAIGFGLAHSYQGVSGMIKVFAMGLAFGGLYLLCGSIWIPMLAHFLVDAIQGLTLVELNQPQNRRDRPAEGLAH